MPFTAGGLVKAASGALKAGGGGDSKKNMVDDEDIPLKKYSYHRGGKVRRTGLANLKKGEVVLTKKQARKRDAKRGSKR